MTLEEHINGLQKIQPDFCVSRKRLDRDKGIHTPSTWMSVTNLQSFDDIYFRQMLDNELVLDLDKPTIEENLEFYKKISPRLNTLGLKYEVYPTGSKGIHINLFFDKKLSDNERQALVYSIVSEEDAKHLDSAFWTKQGRQLLAIEYQPHFKTGNMKTRMAKVGEGLNHFPEQLKVTIPKQQSSKIGKTLKEILESGNPNEQERCSGIMKIHNVNPDWSPQQILDYISVNSKWENFDKTKSLKKIESLLSKYPHKKEYLKTQGVVENPSLNRDLQVQILQLNRQGEKERGVEVMVEHIKETNHIYTTIDDKNPEVWMYQEGVYRPNGRSLIKKIIRDVVQETYTTYYAHSVLDRIMPDTQIEQEVFFNNTIVDEIAVNNGLLNVITKELTPFNPERIHFNKLPMDYDTNADCPGIKQFFKDVLKNEEDVPVIQELFGYLLLKEYKIEKAFMLVGTGRNGKGKTLDLIKRFLGPENCSSVPLQQFETDNFAPSELFSKLVNISGDLDKKALDHTGKFKELTGRDLISAARKFKTRLHFENYAKMMFAANELPQTHDLTPAFFERWIILEFPFTFKTQEEIDEISDYKIKQWLKLRDTDIIKKIATPQELSGLLNWGLEGLTRLLANGDFSYCQNVDDVKKFWLRNSDSFTAYCQDELEGEYSAYLTKAELHSHYHAYTKEKLLKPVSRQRMNETLHLLFGAVSNSKKISGTTAKIVEGIKFKNKAPKYLNWGGENE